jgi:hypothetical protein
MKLLLTFVTGWLMALCPNVTVAQDDAAVGAAGKKANPFRQLLSPKDYEDAKRQLRDDIETVGKLMVSGMPLDGAQIVAVPTGGVADQAGLRNDDVIYRAGRWEVWGGQPPLRMQNRKQQIFAVRPEDGKKLDYWAEPGALGVRIRIYNRPEIAFLRGRGNRSPDWDRDLVAAMLAYRSDPAFAETAWHLAVERGCEVDRLGAYFAAIFRAQWPDDAGQVDAAIDRFVGHFESVEKIPSVFLTGLVPLLAARGRIEDLAALSHVRSPNFPWRPAVFEKMREWRPGGGSLSPLLLSQSGASKGKDITRELVRFVGGAAQGEFRIEATEHVGAGAFKLETFGLERPLKNAHLRWVFQIESITRPEGRPAALRLAIIRGDTSRSRPPVRFPAIPPFHDVRLVAVALLGKSDEGDSRLELSSSGVEAAWQMWTRQLAFPKPNVFVLRTELDRPDADLAASRTNELDLIRIDGEVGVWLNGTPCLQLPVDPAIDDVRFHLHLSGAVVKTQDLSVAELP